MKNVKFIFIFDTKEDAEIISKSLYPEIKHKIPKTNVKIRIKDNTFFLTIEADDLSSLRAASNSYLRWINTALNVKTSV